MDEFITEMVDLFKLKITELPRDFTLIEKTIKEKNMKAIFMGTRVSDPNSIG
jgi:hypothetical protein